MEMLKIYLTRHGQNIDNQNGILNGRRDEPLTGKGVNQAHEIANKIVDANLIFCAVYSSPLSRAFETAKIISETIDAPTPQKKELLIERDFGVMTGKRVSEIETLCAPDIIKTDTVTHFLNPNEAETFPDLTRRAGLLLEKIKNKHKSGNVLLVCHGDIGKMIYAKYYNLNWVTVLSQFHFGNGDLLLLSEDSPAGEPHVVHLNQRQAL
ncbi:MAG: histidine phosphatase family protein [Minisyncoccota bacterium]